MPRSLFPCEAAKGIGDHRVRRGPRQIDDWQRRRAEIGLGRRLSTGRRGMIEAVLNALVRYELQVLNVAFRRSFCWQDCTTWITFY
jgi:hypothetical protein